ncbi:MAG: DUF6783 domain-containing protein, partial [Hungatella sp.]|uniref:DUF6783 domain-containing protein n=1 Tax=Hungatella sp. TaxID=2613924 RepID=UPI0039955862
YAAKWGVQMAGMIFQTRSSPTPSESLNLSLPAARSPFSSIPHAKSPRISSSLLTPPEPYTSENTPLPHASAPHGSLSPPLLPA